MRRLSVQRRRSRRCRLPTLQSSRTGEGRSKLQLRSDSLSDSSNLTARSEDFSGVYFKNICSPNYSGFVIERVVTDVRIFVMPSSSGSSCPRILFGATRQSSLAFQFHFTELNFQLCSWERPTTCTLFFIIYITWNILDKCRTSNRSNCENTRHGPHSSH